MPTVHLPGPLPGRLVQSQQWFDEFTAQKPGKKALSLHTDAAIQLLVSSLDVADFVLRELYDKDGPHNIYVAQRKRMLVGELAKRSRELLAEMTRDFGVDSHDAISRQTLLLLQAGYVITQLDDTSLCEDWIGTGNELAAKLLLARYNGEPRPDRVTTYRELLYGLLTLPEAALDQPVQGSAELGEFWRLASIDILAEEHVQVSDYDLDRHNVDQSYADSKQYAWEATHGYRPLSDVPEALREGRPRLSPGTVVLRTTRPTTEPLHQGEQLPDVAPEHRTDEEMQQLVAARATLLSTCHQDPTYMQTALPRLDAALTGQPGQAHIRPVYGQAPAAALPYLTEPQPIRVSLEKMQEFATDEELLAYLRKQKGGPLAWEQPARPGELMMACDFATSPDGDDFRHCQLYRLGPDGQFIPVSAPFHPAA